MTGSSSKAREGFFCRQRNTLLLSAAFLLIFISQNYFECSFTFIFGGDIKSVGQKANSIRKISQGLVNIVGIGIVNYFGYATSFIAGTAVAYPLIFIAAYIQNKAAHEVALIQISPLLKTLLWIFSFVQGAGHSIIWIAQGCYIGSVIEGIHCPEAFSLFAFFYNFSYPCGSVLMKYIKFSNSDKYTTGLIVVCSMSFLALPFYLLLKKQSISRESRGSLFPFTRANLGANLKDYFDIFPSTLFMGVVIGFIGSQFARPLIDDKGLGGKIFFFFLFYGLSACVASIMGSFLMKPKNLWVFAIAACVLHAGAIGMYQYAFLKVGKPLEMSVDQLGYLCYAYATCYGLASSTYITLMFTLVALRYEKNMGFAMWSFQVLNCLATGIATYTLEGRVVAIFSVFGALGYGSVFYTLFRIHRMRQQLQSEGSKEMSSKNEFPESNY